MALADGGLPTGLPHTDPAFYLSQAAHWANAYIAGGGGDTLNLYDVSGFAHYDLYRAIQAAGDPAGLEVTRAQLLANLKAQLDGAVAQGATDPFGFGFTWAQWDTTTHGAGLVGDGERVRRAHRHVDLRRPRGRVARQHPGRERVGLVADRRRRQGVPRLHPSPDREHRGAPRRHGAGAQGRRGRGPERHDLPRHGVGDEPLSGGRLAIASAPSTAPGRSSPTTCSRSRPSSRRSTSLPRRRSPSPGSPTSRSRPPSYVNGPI